MITARTKQKEEADNNNSRRVVKTLEERDVGTKGKKITKQSLIGAVILILMLLVAVSASQRAMPI